MDVKTETNFEADVASLLARHGLDLAETRDRIETYRVIDATGAVRTQGATREAAFDLAERLSEDAIAAPLTVERVLHWSFTQREAVRTFALKRTP